MQHPPQPPLHIPQVERSEPVTSLDALGINPKASIVATARALPARGWRLVIVKGGIFAAQRVH